MRPLIAITTTTGVAGSLRLPQAMLSLPYIAAIEECGGTAVLLTPAHAPESISRILEQAQGFILSGGEDVDPAYYGQDPHPALGEVNRLRDELEFAALEIALERRMPIFAICRGLQVLNVALGGTLYQDLPSQLPSTVLHRQRVPVNQRAHLAKVEAGSGLHGILGTGELWINSFHHQAIDRLAPGLRASAWAEDGVIEAVEAEDLGWVYGVQWHPERGEADVPGGANPDRELFRAFIEAARDRRESPATDLSR